VCVIGYISELIDTKRIYTLLCTNVSFGMSQLHVLGAGFTCVISCAICCKSQIRFHVTTVTALQTWNRICDMHANRIWNRTRNRTCNHAAPYADLGCRMQKHRPLAPGMVRSPLPLITEPNVAWLWWLIKWAPVCSTSSNSARQISYLLGHLSKIQSTNQARRCLTLVIKCISVCLTLSNSTQHTCHLVLRGPSTRAIFSTNLRTIRCAIW
jgi:hypothetical protein